MIIGNNTPNNNNNFINRNNPFYNPSNSKITNENKKISNLSEDLSHFKYTNPKNRDAMCDKSIAMLQERYEKNLITLDEFKKQSEKIRKFREKNY